MRDLLINLPFVLMVNNYMLITTTILIVAILVIVIVLNLIQNRKNKKYKNIINKLEVKKNEIDSTPIVPELSKVEGFLNNEKLENKYNDWKERLDSIKGKQIPKITDMIIEADYSVSQRDYKGALYKIAKLEIEIYKARSYSEVLLGEIKDVTSSESRSRSIITSLKSEYRTLYQTFNNTIGEYGSASKYVGLQFENIAKRFETFEDLMDKNQYMDVGDVITSIQSMLKHMHVVMEEVPPIVLLAENVLPKRIEDLKKLYKKMLDEQYPLDYLNIDYNIVEANNKIADVVDRLKILNLEDSLFELKVLMEYFDGVFADLDKEKVNRNTYEELNSSFKTKLDGINKLISEIFTQINEIKDEYDLSMDDIKMLNDMRNELEGLNTDYKVLVTHTSNHTFAYSKLIKEIEGLMQKLNTIENRLDNSLETIGSMKDDETRAHQQLEEVKSILKDAKYKMRDYDIPVIPKSYYVELNEANDAIKEISKELARKPINITTLNTRVDTARDLVLKLFSKTKDMGKTSMFAERAIVYGNKYRVDNEELDKALCFAEALFFKGDYSKSLEVSLNALNKVDSGLYDKILKAYKEK